MPAAPAGRSTVSVSTSPSTGTCWRIAFASPSAASRALPLVAPALITFTFAANAREVSVGAPSKAKSAMRPDAIASWACWSTPAASGFALFSASNAPLAFTSSIESFCQPSGSPIEKPASSMTACDQPAGSAPDAAGDPDAGEGDDVPTEGVGEVLAPPPPQAARVSAVASSAAGRRAALDTRSRAGIMTAMMPAPPSGSRRSSATLTIPNRLRRMNVPRRFDCCASPARNHAMKIAVPRETADGETRVAATPQTVKALVDDGNQVLVQAGAGEASSIPDAAFREAGAEILPDAAALYSAAEMVLRVGRPSDEEIQMLRSGTVIIGTLGTLANPKLATALAERGLTAISMDAIPRITRAQSMDTLSSQATVGGYKAVLIAAERLPKFMPLLTTAAGTVRPAKGIVMGAGVAGLMAIGTARRLGAVVEATDVRPVVKEQVESLGGTFLSVEMTDEEKAKAETAGGYATEMSDDYKRRQAALIAERVKEADFIITTALIPGRPAPKLVTDEMVASMKPGSVIVDMAAEMGGNVEGTEPARRS